MTRALPQLPLPLRAPHSGPETSIEAAESLSEPTLARLEAKVLEAIRAAGVNGLCDHEGAELTGLAQNTYRPRRRALALMGLVAEGGRTRMTPSGRRAVVWMANLQVKSYMLRKTESAASR